VINLKVFWLNNSKDKKDIPMFRSETPCINSSELKISKESLFNLVTIANPSDSNCIYTLYSLYISSKDMGKVMLYMGEGPHSNSNTHNIQHLKIEHKIADNLPKNLIELYESNLIISDTIEFTTDNYAILLPGGSLVISIEKPICNAVINITWSIEEF
jgi:hypothetical protein